MNGVIIVDKPAGMTSHDVVNKARKIFNQKKIGHTGTLDPDATGVLVLCFGQATKIIPYLEESDKGYQAVISFGRSTTTLDAAGDTTAYQPVSDVPKLNQAILRLTTITKLKPPQVSAIKVDGKKLYEYARRGIEVDVDERPMRVLKVTAGDLVFDQQEASIELDLVVSKGTYIRSLVQYLSEEVGIPAHLARLRRSHSGRFQIKDAVPLDQLTMDTPMLSIEDALPYPIKEVDEDTALAIFRGKPLENVYGVSGSVVFRRERALAIYETKGEMVVPSRVFVYED